MVDKEPSNGQQKKKDRAVWKWKPGFLWPSFLPLSLTTASQTNPDIISHNFISSFQFLFSSSNIWTNKPLRFVCIKRVLWVDNETMQKVNEKSVITSPIAVPPKLCSNTERVSV